MSLFLNNASQSNPPVVCLLTPGAMEEQLNRACQAFVDHTVKARYSFDCFKDCTTWSCGGHESLNESLNWSFDHNSS